MQNNNPYKNQSKQHNKSYETFKIFLTTKQADDEGYDLATVSTVSTSPATLNLTSNPAKTKP